MAHIEVTVNIFFCGPSSVSTTRELKQSYSYGDNPRYALESQILAMERTVAAMREELVTLAKASGASLNPADCREYPRLIG